MNVKNIIRVVLADDHAIIRRGIRRILEKDADILVIAEADSGTSAIQLVKEFKPDVLVLDIEMPDMRGDCVARELRSVRWPVAILILSAFSDQHFIDEIMRIGVDGYVAKGESPKNIRAAVHQVSGKQQTTSANIMLFFMYVALLLDVLKSSPLFALIPTDINFL
jgi:DNA-binding NarL/FixJ family response regulator